MIASPNPSPLTSPALATKVPKYPAEPCGLGRTRVGDVAGPGRPPRRIDRGAPRADRHLPRPGGGVLVTPCLCAKARQNSTPAGRSLDGVPESTASNAVTSKRQARSRQIWRCAPSTPFARTQRNLGRREVTRDVESGPTRRTSPLTATVGASAPASIARRPSEPPSTRGDPATSEEQPNAPQRPSKTPSAPAAKASTFG